MLNQNSTRSCENMNHHLAPVIPRPNHRRSLAAAVMSATMYKPPDAMDVDIASLEVAPALPPSLSGLVPASTEPLLLRRANINPEFFVLLLPVLDVLPQCTRLGHPHE